MIPTIRDGAMPIVNFRPAPDKRGIPSLRAFRAVDQTVIRSARTAAKIHVISHNRAFGCAEAIALVANPTSRLLLPTLEPR